MRHWYGYCCGKKMRCKRGVLAACITPPRRGYDRDLAAPRGRHRPSSGGPAGGEAEGFGCKIPSTQ
eukprot:732010-Pleurochrysis_carterae.AAC.1